MNELKPLLSICTQKTKRLVRDGPLKNSQEVTREANHVVSTLITGDMTNTKRLSGADLKVLVARGEKLKQVARIVVENVTSEDILFIKSAIHGQGGPAHFGIAEILELIVSPSNGSVVKSLNLLNVSSFVMIFHMLKISLLFPNLKTLEFEKLTISQSALNKLFTSFPGLEYLHVGNTSKLDNLKGIGNLQNLEVLVICNNSFVSSRDIIEIFQLRRLRVLNLSGELSTHSNNVLLFLDCNAFLPELRFLDISSNYINENLLNKLLELHPKLQLMSLLGTRLEKHPQLENSNVSLLTTENLEMCIKSLDHYNQKGSWNTLMARDIIEKMQEIVVNRFEEQSQDVLRNAAKAMLSPNNPENQAYAGAFMFKLIWPGRHVMFNDGEFLAIVRTFLIDWTDVWKIETGNDHTNYLRKQVRIDIWRLLAEMRTRSFCGSLIDPIIHRTVSTLKRARDTMFAVNSQILLAMGALFFCSGLHRDNKNPSFKELYKDNVLKDCLIQFMD